jgi:hypothetical protein
MSRIRPTDARAAQRVESGRTRAHLTHLRVHVPKELDVNRKKLFGIVALALIGGAGAFAFGSYRSAMIDAERAFSKITRRGEPPLERFDPGQLASLPEIAQRYFRHAIAPGTPLYSSAELEMHGIFLLGEKDDFQTYEMTARQALGPPDQFVWIPKLRSGAMSIAGSDALVRGEAWTRFWLLGLLPVAQERTRPDLVRSAQFRAAVEGALWLPTSLLPRNGVQWEQVAPDEARITLQRFNPAISFNITLDQTGAVKQVVGQRWSNANLQKTFRPQPFGGTVLGERSFQGLTIPSRVAVGNHYGTDEYLPFFQAEISRASYR